MWPFLCQILQGKLLWKGYFEPSSLIEDLLSSNETLLVPRHFRSSKKWRVSMLRDVHFIVLVSCFEVYPCRHGYQCDAQENPTNECAKSKMINAFSHLGVPHHSFLECLGPVWRCLNSCWNWCWGFACISFYTAQRLKEIRFGIFCKNAIIIMVCWFFAEQ